MDRSATGRRGEWATVAGPNQGSAPRAAATDDATPEVRNLRLRVGERSGEVSARLIVPPAPRAVLALAHGAGAGMHHRFLAAIADLLAAHGVATLRYQFPYSETGGRRPDPRPVLVATVAAAVREAARVVPGVPLLAGGKSMGGRMSSHAAAEGKLAGVAGLVFLGFPLHPAGRPGTERADHLPRVEVPMLFLQGTRDALADLDLLRPILVTLGERVTLHLVDGADHSFHVLKRSGRDDRQVLAELAATVAVWVAGRGAPNAPVARAGR